jgi:hypothetical protein
LKEIRQFSKVWKTFRTIQAALQHILFRSVADPDPDQHVFGLLDPDPLVRGMDPDPSTPSKNRKTMIPTAV